MKYLTKTVFILGLILLFSLFLRFYQLDSVPSGFHQDEVANTYVGRFTLLNGIDLYGNKSPLLYFDKHGDYPPIIPMYVQALGTFLFGVTVFGSRFFTALVSSLIIIPVFFLSLWAFKDKKTALFSALLAAITPWLVSFARIGTEGSLAMTIYMFGIMGIVFSFQRKNNGWLIISFLLLFLTYFIYPGYRIVVPLTFVASLIIFARNINKRQLVMLGILTAITIITTLYISSTNWGKGRFNQTSIMSAYQDGKNPLSSYIYNENNTFTARVFNNKIVYFSREFTKQYLSYFSPVYLFVDGGVPDWFDVPNTGLFYLTYLLLLLPLLFPYFHLLKVPIDKKLLLFLLFLLIIAPIPAALTTELTPHTHRSLLMSVLFIFIFSYGFLLLQKVSTKRLINLAIGGILAIEFIFFFHNYFQHVSMYTAISRSDANKNAAIYVKDHHQKYNKVYMMATGWFPIYYLYFANNFDKSLAGKFHKNFRLDSIENIEFVDSDCPPKGFSPKEHSLIIASTTCDTSQTAPFKTVDTISAASKVPIYTILENK